MRAAVVFLLLTACTHHRPLHQARGLANGDEVVVENHRGQSQPARIVHAANGEIELHSPIGVLPSQQVARIKETSHGVGALEGLGLGVLVGGTIGAVAFYASGDDECNDNSVEPCLFAFSAEGKAAIGGIALGAVGGLLGLVIGAATGSTTIYEEGDTRVTPFGPQGSTAGVTVTF